MASTEDPAVDSTQWASGWMTDRPGDSRPLPQCPATLFNLEKKAPPERSLSAADLTDISSNNPERSAAVCYATCMAETAEEMSDRRQNLIRAARVRPNPDFRPLLETSNADDLEWLLEKIDAQIVETPQWVDDRASLKQILARLRAKRAKVADAFGNRRTAEKLTDPQAVRRRVNIKMILLGAAILIAFIALLVAIFR